MFKPIGYERKDNNVFHSVKHRSLFSDPVVHLVKRRYVGAFAAVSSLLSDVNILAFTYALHTNIQYTNIKQSTS